MPAIDLTHLITPDMPVYPGAEPPSMVEIATVAREGYAEKRLGFHSHTGTHIDAPAHIFTGGKTLDALPIDHFLGRALTLQWSDPSASKIELNALKAWEKQLGKVDFLLLSTGWGRRWGRTDYERGFPTLTVEAARWLTRFHLKGIGVDAPSFDPIDSTELTNHHLLLGAEILLIENLNQLNQLPETSDFCCFPLYLQQADGSPVRAMAHWPPAC